MRLPEAPGQAGKKWRVQVPCSEGTANHTGPRVMAVFPRGDVASVDRGRYGQGIEPRNRMVRSADGLGKFGRPHWAHRPRKRRPGSARSEIPCTYRSFLRGTREVPPLALAGRPGPCGQKESTATMRDGGKSDQPIVPTKGANQERGRPRSAERLEGRGLAKGTSEEQTRFWTQGQTDLPHALDRIREAARRDKDQTSLSSPTTRNVLTRGRSPVR